MSEYILKTTNLTKTYKGYNAVNNVSITLEPGKIYGLIGRNGAGKSTLLKYCDKNRLFLQLFLILEISMIAVPVRINKLLPIVL